jgi:hypothetical protein
MAEINDNSTLDSHTVTSPYGPHQLSNSQTLTLRVTRCTKNPNMPTVIFDDVAELALHDGAFWLDGMPVLEEDLVKCIEIESTGGTQLIYLDDDETFAYHIDNVSILDYIHDSLPSLTSYDWLDFVTSSTWKIARIGDRTCVKEFNGIYIYSRVNKTSCLITLTELMYECREYFLNHIQYGVQPQSDNEISYSASKYYSRQSHKAKICTSLKKKITDIRRQGMNPKKRKKLKTLQRKLHSNSTPQGVLPESGNDPAKILEVLEKCASLFLIKYFDKPIFQALSAAILLFRGSVTTEVYKVLQSLITDANPIGATFGDFVGWLKSAVVNMDKFKNNRFAKPFIRFVSKMFTTFLCPELRLKVSKLFDENSVISSIMSFFGDEFNPLESFLHFFTYLTNAVDVYVTTGTLDGFLETQTVDDEILVEMREVRDAFMLFKNGNLEFLKEYKVYDFVRRLACLKERLQVLRKSRRSVDLKELDNWVKEVDTITREVATTQLHTKAKIQGYFLSISSGSGISKGHLMKLFTNTIAAANNIPFGPGYAYNLNQCNKFQSGWKNHTTIVMVDDAAAMNATVTDALNLADWLLRASNNIPHELLGADISEKGSLYNRSLIECWSSNSFDMFFNEKANFPSALQRRFRIKIIATVKPEYTKTSAVGGSLSSQIDYNSMTDEMREEIAPDAWLFTIYNVDIIDMPITVKSSPGAVRSEVDNDYVYKTVTYKGMRMVGVSVDVLLDYLIYDSAIHFEQQQQVLKMSEKVNNPDNYCLHGKAKNLLCTRCIKERCELNNTDVIVAEGPLPVFGPEIAPPESIKEVHAKIFGPNAVLPRLIGHGFQETREVKLKVYRTYVKEELYKSRVVFNDQVHFVTRVVDTTSVAHPLLNRFLGVRPESETTRVKCLKGLIELVSNRNSRNEKAWSEVEDIHSYCKLLKKELLDTLQSWFDRLVIDVFLAAFDKITHYITNVMKSPWDFIPSIVEGTVLGSHIHSKRWIYWIPMVMDWVEYQNAVFNAWTYNPYAISSVQPSFRHVKRTHSKVGTKSRMNQRMMESVTSINFNKFVVKAGFVISNKEKELKDLAPDFMRDTILPLLTGCGIVSIFIPKLCSNLSNMYVEQEVGHLVSVEEIQDLDNDQKANWYAAKKEIMYNKVSMEDTIKYSELENLLAKNAINVLNLETSECTGGFSPKNQFLILPYHFVRDSIGNILRVRKGPFSLASPGNAYVEFQLTEELVRKLPGDSCVIYLEKHMDHIRTKDVLKWFPTSPSVDGTVGRLVWRNKQGEVELIDAKDVKYNNYLNNEYVFAQTPKNPFVGYQYKAETRKGMCGAVLVNHTHKKSHIMGIHVGGRPSDNFACSSLILRSDVETAINSFGKKLIETQSCVSLESYGIDIFNSAIYNKNPAFDTEDRLDDVQVLGTVNRRISPTSKIVDTPICKDVIREFKLKSSWGAPSFKFNDDKRHGVRSLYRTLAKKNVLKHSDLLALAISDYKSGVKEALDKNIKYWADDLFLLNDHQIINGASKKFVTGMNMSTKFDAHMSGNKSDHATLVDGQWYFNDYVWDEYKIRLGKMMSLECTNELLVQSLKNEAIPLEKVAVGKVRSFFMCGTPFQMIMRKMTLTTCRFFCLNSPFTEVSVGINPHSTGWDKMFKEIKTFKNYLATDFAGFDLTSLFEVISASLDLIFFPLRYVGNLSEEEDNILVCIKHSILFALCDISGDVVVMRGIIPSGINLTSIIGCVVNSLNYRMAYYFLNKGTKVKFRDVCVLRTFGDDAIGSTSDKRFSIRNILFAFNTIGIHATDAQKSKISKVTFYPLAELEFLKRMFVYDKDFRMVVAPLLDSSRFKMLCSHIPTKTMSIEMLTGQCVDNFLLESSFHGRKVYEHDRSVLTSIIRSNKLERFCQTLELTFDDRLKIWRETYQITVLDTNRCDTNPLAEMRLAVINFWDSHNWFEWTTNQNMKNTCSSVSRAEDKTMRPGLDLATNENPYVLNRVEPEELELLVERQSGTEKDEVLTYIEADEEEVNIIGGPMPIARSLENDVSLAAFLQRPVKIATFAWGNVVFTGSFDPWNLLLSNPRIANRISNYKLMRGKVHLKFTLNGNAFYYGSIMCCYLPFAGADYRTHTSPLIGPNRMHMSQCPKTFLDPTTSKSVTMQLPFFYPADYIDLQAPDADRSLGTIFMYQIAGLKHANQDIVVTGATVSVNVFAWFEDVELQGPTKSNIQGISAQSGTEEETAKKPISQVCTAVANAASHLAPIPIIGPYALAIEQGARMTSTVASALGFSQPLDCVQPTRYQPRMVGNFGVTNTTDSSMRLSLDVKQDTTIDPRCVGLTGEDELSIQKIASTDSFVNTFSWDTSGAPGALLWNIKVSPMLFYNPVTTSTVYMTATCGASLPFQFWNGSMIFRFQVICSANHKGRLAVVYDPNGTSATNEENVAYTEIIDIGLNREFEIKINNFQSTQWLPLPDIWWGLPCEGTTAVTADPGMNGTIAVYILNELTSPSADPTIGQGIELACYARAGPDFQLANPGAKMSRYLIPGIEPQSDSPGDVADSDITTEHAMSMPDKQNRVYIGEKVESYRSLIKRTQAYMRYTKTDAFNSMTIVHQGFPQPKGYIGNTPALGANEVVNTYLNHLFTAFAGWKGGFRWKILVLDQQSVVTLGRCDESKLAPYFVTMDYSTTLAQKATDFTLSVGFPSCTGMTISHLGVNPMLEVELPFYSRYKFVAGKPRIYTEAFLDAYNEGTDLNTTRQSHTGSASCSAMYFVAAAEDFTCYFFTGWSPIDISVI